MSAGTDMSAKNADTPLDNAALGRLTELDRKRLEAEKLWEYARSEQQRWANEEARRWKVAVKLGAEWMALKRELGLLPDVKDHSPIEAASASNPESNSAASIG